MNIDSVDFIEPLDIFKSDLRPMQYWAMLAEDKLRTWATQQPEGFSTGFTDLDKYVRMRDSELITIAAQSSMGKTALGMAMIETMADQVTDGCVAVFSAEMSGTSLVIRMASAMSGVNAHKLQQGKGNPDEIAAMRGAIARIQAKNIWIDDNGGPTTAQMLEQLARLNDAVPVRGMLFDFLELGGDENTTEEQRVGQIAHNLKGIAKTLDIPVIALSQLNDQSEHRANKMPSMNDLRYSRKIGHVSDVVLLLMRPEYYEDRKVPIADIPEADRRGVAYVVVAKQRNGPTGLVKLAFAKEQAKFGNLAYQRTHL